MTTKRTRASIKRRADADRLAELFERGTMLEIIDELSDDPVWTAKPRRHKSWLPSLEVPVDAIGSRGITLLGEALTTSRALEFRLALVCLLLARGAQPCTISETGRSIIWAIDQVRLVDPYAADLLLEVVDEAQWLWNQGQPFEIPPGIDEWIRGELDLLRHQPAEFHSAPSEASPLEPSLSKSPPPPPSQQQQDQDQQPESSPLPDYVDEDTSMASVAPLNAHDAPARIETTTEPASKSRGPVADSGAFERSSQKAHDGAATTNQDAPAPERLAPDVSRPSPSFSVFTGLVKSSGIASPSPAVPSSGGQAVLSAWEASSSVVASSPVSRASKRDKLWRPRRISLAGNFVVPTPNERSAPRSSTSTSVFAWIAASSSGRGATFRFGLHDNVPTGPKALRRTSSGPGSKEVWLCFLDPNLTPNLLEHYLRTGLETFLSVTRDERPHLQDLVDVGSFNNGGPVAPPYPRKVEISTYSNLDLVKKYGAAVGRVEYGSERDAKEAREIFDGRRMFQGDWARDQRSVIWRTEKPRR